MQAPVRTKDEALSNAAFGAVLHALAWPGSTRTLPEPGFAALISALIDRECCVHTPDSALGEQVLRTGARTVGIAEADHVFCTARELSHIAANVATGSDYYPDDGATIVVSARIGEGDRLRLTGPGVDGAVEIRLAGIDRNFWQIRAARIRYPIGFELIVVDGDKAIGIPRSTLVELI